MTKKMMIVAVVLFSMFVSVVGCHHTFIDLGPCAEDEDCDDGDPCTVDVCDVDHSCIQIPSDDPSCDPPPDCVPTEEVCNGLDDDCDEVIDNGTECAACAGGPIMPYYRDADYDGYGDPSVSELMCSGLGATGWIDIAGDCDDRDVDVNPGATEICDGLDNDCDEVIDEDCLPPEVEICNGVDDDLDGNTDEGLLVMYYLDRDLDGYGDPGWFVEYNCPGLDNPNWVANRGDCDDSDAAVHPGAGCPACEVIYFRDADGDSWGDPTSGRVFSCDDGSVVGYITMTGDCDDSNSAVYNGAFEICDGLDNDCDDVVDEGQPVRVEVMAPLPAYDERTPILGFRFTNYACDAVDIEYILEELLRADDGSVVPLCNVFDCTATIWTYQNGRGIGMQGPGVTLEDCSLGIPYRWVDGEPDESLVGLVPAGASVDFMTTAFIRADAPAGRYQFSLKGYWTHDILDVSHSFTCGGAVADDGTPVPSNLGVPIFGPVITVP